MLQVHHVYLSIKIAESLPGEDNISIRFLRGISKASIFRNSNKFFATVLHKIKSPNKNLEMFSQILVSILYGYFCLIKLDEKIRKHDNKNNNFIKILNRLLCHYRQLKKYEQSDWSRGSI